MSTNNKDEGLLARSDAPCDDGHLERCALPGVVVVTANHPSFEALVRLAAPWAELLAFDREEGSREASRIAERAAGAPGVIVRIKHMSHEVSHAMRAKHHNVVIIDNERMETLIEALEKVNHGYEASPQAQAAQRCPPGQRQHAW